MRNRMLPLSARRLRSALACVLLAASLGYLLPSSTARADEVADAQARVDSLQAVVTATTQQLLEGTRQWEADVQALRQVEVQLGNVQRSVQAAQREADAGQERLDQMARRLYTGGSRSRFNIAMTQQPEEFVAAAHDVALVQRAMGSTSDVIAEAAATRRRLQQQQAQVEFLAGRAADLTRRSAQRIAQLQARAREMAAQLEQAQAALQAARERKAAAIAAAAAEKEALERALRDKAARDRAARDKAAREREARRRAVPAGPTTGGAGCTAQSTEGQANGNLDPASLCPLWSAPGQRLRGDAATAFNRMSRYYAATTGGPLCVTDSYRSYSAQVDVYQRKPGLAAVPGTSEHGWGKAVDLCGGVESFGSAAYEWMMANAPRFGWFHPDWAEPSGSKPEAWHWEFSG